MTKKNDKKEIEVKFFKDQIIEELKYKYSRDLLNTFLTENEYTLEEAEKIINRELKRRVN